MNAGDIAVLALGAASVAGELWLFLGPRQRPAACKLPAGGGVQEVCVVAQGGYEPATIVVEAGRPVRLLFYRDETAESSARVVFEGLGIEQELPPFETTAVQFTPTDPGDYPFHGRTAALRGRVLAQVGRESARQNLGKGHAKHG